MTDRAVRLGLGFTAACTSAVLFYGVLRIIQWRLFPDPNPAHVIWSAHAGYFWRCWTVSYAGLLVGFLGYGASKERPAEVARALLTALTVATVVIVAQGLLVP